jgi:predicted alpha/beta superfamily hydrolase
MLKKIPIVMLCLFSTADRSFAQNKASTANKNVQIIDTVFFMPQLNRYRRIWIYLPQTYTTSKKKYPVIYMHDGQNVFDNRTSFAGEWGVDEALDTLGSLVKKSIIVAIDNGGEKRLNEYAPYDFTINKNNGTGNIKGEGEQYVAFIVKTLRPFINKNYRTRKTCRYTFTAGSSMGGLISFYALLKYPKIFGGAGVFSPSFWVAPQLKTDIVNRSKKMKGKVYLYAGKLEAEEMVPDLLTIFNLLHQHSNAKITTVIRAEGKHNEASWRQEFPHFYKWIMQ